MIQRAIVTLPVNAHVAIWVTAIIFSAVHMQFFGFVPRMILGALFGYLAYWSGSLWLPIIAHAFNNMCAAAGMWVSGGKEDTLLINNLGNGGSEIDYVVVAGSLLLSAGLLILLQRTTRSSRR